MPVTTAELAEQLEAATLREEDCRLALERLQVETTLAGEEPGEAEREAESAFAAAKATVSRLDAALTVIMQGDAAERRAAALAEIDRQDRLTLDTLANVEKAAAKLMTAAEAYVRGYDALVRAVGTAQQFINENPRLASDTWLPRPDTLTSEEIGRIATQGAQPPGSAFHSAQYPDVSRIEPLVDRYGSYARHFRDQLARRAAPLAA